MTPTQLAMPWGDKIPLEELKCIVRDEHQARFGMIPFSMLRVRMKQSRRRRESLPAMCWKVYHGMEEIAGPRPDGVTFTVRGIADHVDEDWRPVESALRLLVIAGFLRIDRQSPSRMLRFSLLWRLGRVARAMTDSQSPSAKPSSGMTDSHSHCAKPSSRDGNAPICSSDSSDRLQTKRTAAMRRFSDSDWSAFRKAHHRDPRNAAELAAFKAGR